MRGVKSMVFGSPTCAFGAAAARSARYKSVGLRENLRCDVSAHTCAGDIKARVLLLQAPAGQQGQVLAEWQLLAFLEKPPEAEYATALMHSMASSADRHLYWRALASGAGPASAGTNSEGPSGATIAQADGNAVESRGFSALGALALRVLSLHASACGPPCSAAAAERIRRASAVPPAALERANQMAFLSCNAGLGSHDLMAPAECELAALLAPDASPPGLPPHE